MAYRNSSEMFFFINLVAFENTMPTKHSLSASEASDLDEDTAFKKHPIPLVTWEELASEDNEIWMVRIPNSIKPDTLHDTVLLGGDTVEIEGKVAKFTAKASKKRSQINVVTLKKKGGRPALLRVQLRGTLTFREEVDSEPDLACERIPQPKEVIQPEGVTERHPLFLGHQVSEEQEKRRSSPPLEKGLETEVRGSDERFQSRE
eukprot:maker-scaffold363_size195477-snap-gene-0.41 protein:Tk06653 transcript:maker-scaffold363_size195477-snap-gene-0.41-mRNA-1 annotation:"hypothetical protein DAPPUDRAFT_311457"